MPEIAPGISGSWSAVVAFTNLLFTNAVGLACLPETTRLCVWEREGRAWTFENSPGTTRKTLMLDVSDRCQGWDDSGLLGIAFHPGFATNHFLFVYYTWVQPGTVTGNPANRPEPIRTGAYHDRLSRFTLDSSGAAIPGSEVVYVDQIGNSVWHGGGGLFFHPTTGFLYWAAGDDADSANTQIINHNLFSGVFRIDVDKRGGKISHPIPRQPDNGVTANYYIPNDNPFVNQPGALEEFFCLGLRNPYRMTCDPSTGRIFIGDVGESTREEIDLIESHEAGLNFQWSRIEGAQGDLSPPFIGINRRPFLDYTHDEGRAVIGGYVYRGKEFAVDLGGKYIFGDNVLRTVWMLDETTTPPGKTLLCTIPKGAGPNSGTDYTGLSSFGVDANGEIYVCQMSSVEGRIYKLARGGPPPPTRTVPRRLSETRVFSDLSTLKPAPALIPYTVNSPLWSDGAIKTRWMILPTNTFIGFTEQGSWTFPAGTVFVKNFDLPIDENNPSARRRLETRLLVRDTNGFVYGASYKWRADLSDADLVSTGLTENIVIATTNGNRTQSWFFPGRQDCLRCHTEASGGVLGVKTSQLNGRFTYPESGVTDNQLRTWNHLGLFIPGLNEDRIPHFSKLRSVSDTNAPVTDRIRSYLDANCAHCHRPGGANAFFDARFETPLSQAGIVNGPVGNTLGIAGAKVAIPADTARSILFQRINRADSMKMPPLARNVVDINAVTTLAEWINSLAPVSSEPPAPWIHRDVGNPVLPGSVSYVNGQFNLIAAGDDIWGEGDTFLFAYRFLDGDGQITARVLSLQPTDPWAKAGVMFRESLASNAMHSAMLVTPANGAFFQQRAAPGGPSSNQEASPSALAPCWLRLSRAGNIFTGSVSTDGVHWAEAIRASLSLPSRALVGLALTSHQASIANSALFDQVTVTRTSGPAIAYSVKTRENRFLPGVPETPIEPMNVPSRQP